MSRLDELPPDQRATLSLLLRQRKRYAEVALLLGISERAVHDRAHGALAVLAPRQARELDPAGREEIGEYVLGQAGVAERLRTRSRLAGSEPARAWAQALSGELAPLGGALPEIPPAAVAAAPIAVGASSSRASGSPATPAPTLPSAEAAPPSSRLGGALLLAAIVVAVIVAVVLLTNGGGKSKATASTARTTTSKTSGSTPNVAALPLRSPSRRSRSIGLVEVLSEKGKQAYLLDAENLPETHGFFYAVWLYNSPTSALALSRAPAVGASKKLAGEAVLPSNAAEYHEILVTRETATHPTHPGRVILRGPFSLTGSAAASAGS